MIALGTKTEATTSITPSLSSSLLLVKVKVESAYWEDESTDEERENGGNGGANEASDHEAVESRRRWEAENQSGSVKNRNVQ